MDLNLYLRLSGLMFLEFAVWGAWMPVLALRLLGPLKMTGRQTGWIYATLPLACIFAPLASGYLADSRFNAETIILVSHAAGAVLLFLAAKQTRFWGMFTVMLLYSIFYTATLPLVNKIVLQQSPATGIDVAYVFLWAPVSWFLVGYLLTGLRKAWKMGGDGPDSLYLGAILSVAMAVVSFFQLPLAPTAAGNPMLGALAMLQNTDYLVFMLAQLAVSGMMQFYFLGTGPFMQDRGIQGRNVSAAMAIAQAVQALATIFLLLWLIGHAGYKMTFIVGALCWTALYLIYVARPRPLAIIPAQAFHGMAYALFMIGGQFFVNAMAPAHIGGSAQSLIFIATNGIGLFLGTQLAGAVMQRNNVDGKFQWPRIWAVPLAITLAGAIVLAAGFKVPCSGCFQKGTPAATSSDSSGR